jgi:leucyl aminopeptidase
MDVLAPEDTDAVKEGHAVGAAIAAGQAVARGVQVLPGNVCTPTYLGEFARELAGRHGFGVTVLDRAAIVKEGMKALMAVAQGSEQEPRFIALEYKGGTGAPIVLVGKGVTFDTGGISNKPAPNMEDMKYDMSGAAAVLGAMKAIAQLQPSIPVTALAPTVENMPGSRAQRPGDIVKSLSGKSIEVINTDAEGRLILCDALTYAQRLGCTHLVDAATLTGSVVIALGHVNIGAYSNNDEFESKLLAAAKAEGEKVWPMPMDDDYKEQLKSPFADLANVGGRPAGSITAAWFLKEFTGDLPWVHLDIAGTAWLDESKPWMAKGPTGVGVRSFVHLAMNW